MLTTFADDETSDVHIKYDDETLQGNYFEITLDDKHGMELLAQLCDFYERKGYRPLQILNSIEQQARPSFWKRIFGGKA